MGQRRPAYLKKLLRAYADEWFGHYNYQLSSLILRGRHSPAVIRFLEHKSITAFERSQRIARRLLALGVQPIEKLTDLPRYATPKPFRLPKSLADLKGIIAAVLDAEKTSFHTFQMLRRMTRGKDPRTFTLVQQLAHSARTGRKQIRRLLHAVPA